MPPGLLTGICLAGLYGNLVSGCEDGDATPSLKVVIFPLPGSWGMG